MVSPEWEGDRYGVPRMGVPRMRYGGRKEGGDLFTQEHLTGRDGNWDATSLRRST
jgi:hypothetical protein